MQFLVDAQLPPALARWLADQGHEAEHVVDIGMAAASDTAIWEQAKVAGAAIKRNMQTGSSPAIVWLRIGNTRRTTLLEWFEPLLPQIVNALEDGEILIEVE